MIKFQKLVSYKKGRLGDERGIALIVYLFVLATMSALAVAAIQITNLGLLTSESYRTGQKAFYSAEVGLDLAVNAIVEEFEDLVPYTTSLDDPNADADGFITVENYRDYKVRYKVTNPLKKYLYQSSVGSSFIFHHAHTYDIEATATSLKDSSREFLKERIRILETPLVQYFMFYGQTGGGADLELFPGPEMNMWGRIHSNGDIYIGSSGDGRGGFSRINLRNYDDQGNLSPHLMSASGKITTQFKYSGQSFDNTVFVKTSNEGTTFSPTEALPPTIDKSNESEQESRFNDYVLVNEPKFVTPSISLIERGGFYEKRAKNPKTNKIDSIIITGTGGLGSGNIEVSVSRPTLTNVTDLIKTGRTTSGNSIPGLPFPIIQETRNAFEDCREDDRSVDTTDIDINALQRWYVAYLASQGLSLGGNGILVYTSRSPDSSFTNHNGNLQAIRLVRIDRFHSIPELLDETTLVTDNPLYVQGDFNSINTKGVALVSDAFNILSNDFVNHYPGYGSIPPNGGKVCGYGQAVLFYYFRGSETTVNAAIFTGNVHNRVTDGDGAHVFPRFHEWWHVKPNFPYKASVLNILGSFINLWTSKQANSEWCPAGGDCYSAPIRNWGWDVRFEDPNFWPPFVPSVFSVERVGFLEK
tara:strand:- start:9565 stop:11490 length:1926 start_codon:yes stop_codon:yes gene_type:complete